MVTLQHVELLQVIRNLFLSLGKKMRMKLFQTYKSNLETILKIMVNSSENFVPTGRRQ